jgi:shikimate kinase/3-dehydroquinate synthase
VAALTDRSDRAVAFIGFMGAGKSTAAWNAGAALHAEPRDVDAIIEQRLGKPIARVFSEEGEAAFRAIEEQTTLELLADPATRAISLGGGAIASERVQAALAEHLVVWLDVAVEVAWERAHGSDRPLARDRASFGALFERRRPLYAQLADVILPASRSHAMAAVLPAATGLAAGTRMLWAATASGDYPVYVGSGLLSGGFWPPTVAGRRFVVTDGRVGSLYGALLADAAGRVAIMPGEQSKTVAHAEIVWTELAKAGMTREDVVVALGGGVVGDLAGFCAATYQRGVRYVQVPTTLVAQVDSAYGGKTGVDLAEAKNYVGAYHQPVAVLTDIGLLASLPPEEVGAGYAEVVKTGLISGGTLWERIRSGADPLDPDVVRECALAKLRVVEADERDGGLRQVLNLGHTVGHAIETVTGYARYRHGEAVGLGLLAALRLSGLTELRPEVAELLAGRGLPVRLAGEVDPEAVVAATAKDKKRLGEGPVPFVLLEGPGHPRPGCVVSPDDLRAAVAELAERSRAPVSADRSPRTPAR